MSPLVWTVMVRVVSFGPKVRLPEGRMPPTKSDASAP
jgi:hypothetical protein